MVFRSLWPTHSITSCTLLPSLSQRVMAVERNLWSSTRPVTPAFAATRFTMRSKCKSGAPSRLKKIRLSFVRAPARMRSASFAVSQDGTGTSRWELSVFVAQSDFGLTVRPALPGPNNTVDVRAASRRTGRCCGRPVEPGSAAAKHAADARLSLDGPPHRLGRVHKNRPRSTKVVRPGLGD